MRALVFHCVLLAPLLAFAQVDDATKCNDDYSDCHDSCALKFGMVARDSERLKLAKCIDKCKRVANECKERYFETKNNALDDGALQKKPERDDDLREDNRKSAIIPEDKPARSRSREEEQPKRTATRADELNDSKKKKEPEKASDDPRYDMKFEEEKKPEPKKQKEETARAEPAPAAEEKPAPPPEKKKTSSSAEPEKPKKKERALDEWDPEAL